jgi:hypothetical protein
MMKDKTQDMQVLRGEALVRSRQAHLSRHWALEEQRGMEVKGEFSTLCPWRLSSRSILRAFPP